MCPFKDHYIIKLEGVDSLSQARDLVGQQLLLLKEDLLPLEKDNYYSFQIIGCSVVSKHGDKIGRIKSMWCIKDNDLLVVESEGREILIPFSKSICLEINLKQKVVIIDPPEGLLELNEI